MPLCGYAGTSDASCPTVFISAQTATRGTYRYGVARSFYHSDDGYFAACASCAPLTGTTAPTVIMSVIEARRDDQISLWSSDSPDGAGETMLILGLKTALMQSRIIWIKTSSCIITAHFPVPCITARPCTAGLFLQTYSTFSLRQNHSGLIWRKVCQPKYDPIFSCTSWASRHLERRIYYRQLLCYHGVFRAWCNPRARRFALVPPSYW